MRPAIPFRICAIILILFAVGHTVGFLMFKPPTPEGLALRTAMSETTFHFGKVVRSYADFYRGFGLFVTVYLLFAALIAWQLPNLLRASPELFRTLSAAFLTVQVAGVVLCFIFFAAVQAVFSIAVVACLSTCAPELSNVRATASCPARCASASPYPCARSYPT